MSGRPDGPHTFDNPDPRDAPPVAAEPAEVDEPTEVAEEATEPAEPVQQAPEHGGNDTINPVNGEPASETQDHPEVV